MGIQAHREGPAGVERDTAAGEEGGLRGLKGYSTSDMRYHGTTED